MTMGRRLAVDMLCWADRDGIWIPLARLRPRDHHGDCFEAMSRENRVRTGLAETSTPGEGAGGAYLYVPTVHWGGRSVRRRTTILALIMIPPVRIPPRARAAQTRQGAPARIRSSGSTQVE